ncbi:MAG: NAD(P)H-dependent oxidoreductase, partial [Gammaproteobacteria bacterium]
MNLHSLLASRAAAGKPVRVAMIGAGKFGAMFLAQARRTPGLHIVGIADLDPARARTTLARIGWPDEQSGATSAADALATGATWLTDDAHSLMALEAVEVVVEATGDPAAGIAHALAAIDCGKHIVMVNVEADVLVGPLLAERARQAGVVYSLAWGDQPALICELVDWARAIGFEVVAAGKGTKYLPHYHASTPDTVWGHYGLTPEQAAVGGMNPQMFNSFLDGTKSGIEMGAVANATGLLPPADGLGFPACDVDDLAEILRPQVDGGVLESSGRVEVISSLARDGAALARDLRWGVYCVFRAPDEYVRRCFQEYGLRTDDSGWYSAMYKPYHLIGLELGISVASAACRGEPTGQPQAWRADVVATAKRALKAGEMLDGEGGYTVWGKLVPARTSMAQGALPLGLAHGCRLRRDLPEGAVVAWQDVE